MKTSWQYSEHETTYTVKFDLEQKSIGYGYNKYQTTYTIGDWLTNAYSPLPLDIEAKLMALILKYVDKEQLNEQQLLHYRFWKHLDRNKLPDAQRFSTIKIYDYWQDQFVELNPLGVQYIHPKYDGTERTAQIQRLDHLFFNGPKEPLTLEYRKEIRQLLLTALSAEAGLSSKDLFPLFDYTQLPHKRYEHSNDGGYSGEWWSLEGTHISTGGWSRQGRDGGGSHCSIESVYPSLNGLSGPFEKHKAEVLACLKAAILEE